MSGIAGWNRIGSSLSFSRVQAVIGMLAGTVSVCGALFSIVQFVRPTNTGALVVVVHEAASHRPISDAVVEVLTTEDALLATLTLDTTGRAVQSLREGDYRVRVSHAGYAGEVRHIQVVPGQSIEVNASLHAGSSSSVDHVVIGSVHAVRRALHF